MSAIDWPQVGERVVWFRKGLAEVSAHKQSAGDWFAIVRTLQAGASGTIDEAWIPARGTELHLRRLVSAETAQQWLRTLAAPTRARPRGDLVTRRKRYAQTIAVGTADDQVNALAHAYAEAHRPDIEDVQLLAQLEGLIVAEIAYVLDRPFDALCAELRAGRPRFLDDAPRSGLIREVVASGPSLPDGFRWECQFEVAAQIELTNRDELHAELPARAGAWHALWHGSDDDQALLAISAAKLGDLPLDDAQATIVWPTTEASFIGVFADGALRDPLVEAELYEALGTDILGQGVGWWTQDTLQVRAWREDGVCVAIEIRTSTEEETDEDAL